MTDTYNEPQANGIFRSVAIQEHAIMREAFRALIEGEAKAYCEKYALDYDDIYRTPEEAVYERVAEMCYVYITEDEPESA